MGKLDYRRAGRESLGRPDKAAPLHRRRDFRDAPARGAVRRRGCRDVRQSDTCRRRSPALRPSGPSLNPLDWAGGIWHLSTGVTSAAARIATGAVQIVAGILSPADSSLIGPVSNLRRYSAAQVLLVDVAVICHKFDVTINDVALAAITDSFRAMLMRRGEQPQQNSLRTLVPVSVRSADASNQLDNRVSLMLPYLPIELEDPVERLQAVHSRLTRAKSGGQRQAGSAFFRQPTTSPSP